MNLFRKKNQKETQQLTIQQEEIKECCLGKLKGKIIVRIFDSSRPRHVLEIRFDFPQGNVFEGKRHSQVAEKVRNFIKECENISEKLLPVEDKSQDGELTVRKEIIYNIYQITFNPEIIFFRIESEKLTSEELLEIITKNFPKFKIKP